MSPENYSGLKIAVIGTCQVTGISQTLSSVLPGASISYWHTQIMDTDLREAVMESLPSFDHVITQIPQQLEPPGNTSHEAMRPLDFSNIAELCSSLLYIPMFKFNGFTPDFQDIYFDPDLQGPLHNLHSVIIAAGYAFGLSEMRLKRLLNPIVFRELGLFQRYFEEKQELLDTFQRAGFDLSEHFNDWSRDPGIFMHCMVHPKKEVLARLALMCAEKLGLVEEDTPMPEKIHDSLSLGLILPTYPAFAEWLGCESDAETQLLPGRPYDGQCRFSLDEFISANYRAYSPFPQKIFREKLPPHVVAVFEKLLGRDYRPIARSPLNESSLQLASQ